MLNQSTVFISTTSANTYDEIYLPKVVSKGDIEVTFDVSQLESNSNLILLKGLFILDQTLPSIPREYIYGYNSFSEKQIYEVPTDEFALFRFATIVVLVINKSNNLLHKWVYFIPIQTSKTSYFSEHKRMELVDVQFANELNEDLIGVFQNKSGRILNMKIQ